MSRRKIAPTDSKGYEEITVAIVGNVDSGKSTLTGVLTTGALDDGNGSARSTVFVHKHERETGRTTDIACQPLIDKKHNRIITFVDLAGHENYLKTTAMGLTSSRPDFALICISDKITRSTKEHMGMCISLGIDFAIVFTKIDFVPPDITKGLIASVKRLVETNTLKKIFHIKQVSDLVIPHVIPHICISSKTGENLDLLQELLCVIPKKPQILPEGLVVEHVFNVPGIGTVLSGITGIDISRGTNMLLGPSYTGEFVQVRVRSIHNDYRYEIPVLPKGIRGCVAISGIGREEFKVRRSMLLVHKIPKEISKKFIADVKIYHHPTTIKVGYNIMMHIGALRQPCDVVGIFPADTPLEDIHAGKNIEVNVRSGQKYRFVFAFTKGVNYITKTRLIFREGSVRGVGEVIDIMI